MFKKSAIMSKAWEVYRSIRARYAAWQIARGIVDASFSAALKTAWRIAKTEAAKAAEQARITVALEGPKGATILAIKSEIERLTYMSFRHDIERRRKALEAELQEIIAA